MKSSRRISRCLLALSTLIFVIQQSSIVFATEPMTITKKLDATLNLALPDTIKLGEPFRLTFSVRINQAVKHFSDQPDKISILVPQCCNIDSGNIDWFGKLDSGSVVALNLIAHATRDCRVYFAANVRTGKLYDYSSMYHTSNSIRSQYYAIGDSTKFYGGVVFDSGGMTITELSALGPPPSVASRMVIRQSEDHPPVDSSPLPQIAKTNNYMEISRDSLFSGTARLTYQRGTNNLFRIRAAQVQVDGTPTWISPLRWRFDSPGCRLGKQKGQYSVLELDEKLDSVRLHFTIKNDEVDLVIDLK